MKVKKGLPPIMKAWGECRMASGIMPGKKMSDRQYSVAKTCVAKKMASSLGSSKGAKKAKTGAKVGVKAKKK